MQDERSQHQNRAKAMIILKARVYAAELLERRNSEDAARALAVGSGDRSERIRTYNFSQDRVTDHRISLTRHGIAKMLSGGEMLEEFVEALRRNEAQERLKRES
jgi:peptide chain release factor 1